MKGKAIVIGVIGMFLLTGAASAVSTQTHEEIPMENGQINDNGNVKPASQDEETYAGYMAIHPGDPPTYFNMMLIVEVNSNFGGGDVQFDIEHDKNSITFSADYAVIADCPLDPYEQWEFKLEIWRLDEDSNKWHLSDYEKFVKYDTFGVDDKCNGTLYLTYSWDHYDEADWRDDNKIDIKARLYVRYKRDYEWRTKERYTRVVPIVLEQQPPTPPVIEGPKRLILRPFLGITYVDGMFNFTSTDPDGDNIEYGWEITNVLPFSWSNILYPSGESHTIKYTFDDFGNYTIRARARDNYYNNNHGANAGWSNWSEPFTVKVTRFKSRNVFFDLFNRFPLLERLLSLR